MNNPIKINSLEFENVKRVKAVQLTPTANGLTVIGGRNGQGKTSVIDAITWALGGKKYEPSNAVRDGSYSPPKLRLELSNGMIVERSGANSNLKVSAPDGVKGNQTMLDGFISELALDLPKFMNMSDKDKAKELLSLLGVEEELTLLDKSYQEKYVERREIGRMADSKEKHAAELESYEDAPMEPVSAAELIKSQQEILARNGENQQKRNNLERYTNQYTNLQSRISTMQEELKKLQMEADEVLGNVETAQKSTKDIIDESTAELELQIVNVESINAKVRANQIKADAVMEAGEHRQKYNQLTEEIDDIRQKKTELLSGIKMPLPGLSVMDGALAFNEKLWDCMSGSEQLKVATAIVRELKPECGFVLMDKLEQMDVDTMREFGSWLEAEGLQVIATRVSTNKDECTLIIEDGYVIGAEQTEIKVQEATEKVKNDWGDF